MNIKKLLTLTFLTINNIKTMDSYGEIEDGKLFYKKGDGKLIIFENHAYQYAPLARLSFAYDRFLQDHNQNPIFIQLLQEYATSQTRTPQLHTSTVQDNQITQIQTKRKHHQMINLYLRHKNNQHQRQIG